MTTRMMTWTIEPSQYPAERLDADLMGSIALPTELTLSKCLAFAADLSIVSPSSSFVFDFSHLKHFTPFGMLFVSSAIRRFKADAAAFRTSFRAKGTSEHTYASHMGFWQACTIPIGNNPGQARGSSTYVPITQLRHSDLLSRPDNRGFRAGEVFIRESDRLASLLTQDSNDIFETTISYSLKELFRNAFEHSQSSSVWYCAQYWPSRDEVELCVLDEGVGIAASLRTNPKFSTVTSDEAAIRLAVTRGVTRALRPSEMPFDEIGWKHPNSSISSAEWDNSGLGLYILTELARRSGSLVLISNTDAVEFVEKGSTPYSTAFSGTAVRLRLKPSKLGDLLERLLKDVSDQVPPHKMTPSMRARLASEAGGPTKL